MPTGFEVRFLHRTIEVGVLSVLIAGSNGRFAGATEVCIPDGALDEAADRLQGFPCDPSDERELELGSQDSFDGGGAVRFRFFCRGLAGHALVEVWMESACLDSGADTTHFCSAVEAAAIDSFVTELRRLASEQLEVAYLRTS